MARTMTGAAVGRINTRFLLLALILAVLSAVLVYAAVTKSGDGGSSAADIEVVVAKQEILAGTPLTAGDLAIREVSSAAVGEGYLTSIDDAVGKLTRYPLTANEPVLLSKLVGTITIASNDALAYVLEEGTRAIAVNVDRVTSVGGLILPGDHVDVYWVPFKGAPSYILLSNVEVTAVEQTIVDVAPSAPGLQDPDSETANAGGQRTRATDGEVQPDAITVDLMLTVPQALAMYCAEDFARDFEGSIRLAVRGFGDSSGPGRNAPACPPPLPQEQQ